MFASLGELETLLVLGSGLGHRFHTYVAASKLAAKAAEPTSTVLLPSGRSLDLERSRWEGPLDAEELAYCRGHGIPLAYDCAQVGWVTAACRDDDSIAGAAGAQLFEPPAEVVDAERACASVRLRAHRLADAGTWTLEERAAAQVELIDTVNDAVREFANAHGLPASNSLHWALSAIVRHELTSPDHRDNVDLGEFGFRRWTLDDVPVYRRMLANPRLWEFMPEGMPSSLTEAEARTLVELSYVEGRQEALAVLRDGRPVGQCMLRFDEPFARIHAAEVSYWLDEEHWGQGWMHRILPAFLVRAMRSHPIDVVYAWIQADHAASRRVAESSGFSRDTFLYEAEWADATRRPGFVRYATYRSEWTLEG